MFNEIMKWLGNALLWIVQALAFILDALNPTAWVLKVAEMVIGIMPEPADLSEFYNQYIAIFTWLAPSFQLINHFINLPVFGVSVGAIIIIENVINVFRAWRTIRSFVT